MPKKKIVCIDDDPFYRDLFVNIFESKGFDVIIASEPTEGWEAVKKHRPDLVTLDIMMPESEGVFDGYGLLRKMKEDLATSDIPVIMISALGEREDIKHGLESGAHSYLPKHEMTPGKLVKLIEDILGE